MWKLILNLDVKVNYESFLQFNLDLQNFTNYHRIFIKGATMSSTIILVKLHLMSFRFFIYLHSIVNYFPCYSMQLYYLLHYYHY